MSYANYAATNQIHVFSCMFIDVINNNENCMIVIVKVVIVDCRGAVASVQDDPSSDWLLHHDDNRGEPQ